MFPLALTGSVGAFQYDFMHGVTFPGLVKSSVSTDGHRIIGSLLDHYWIIIGDVSRSCGNWEGLALASTGSLVSSHTTPVLYYVLLSPLSTAVEILLLTGAWDLRGRKENRPGRARRLEGWKISFFLHASASPCMHIDLHPTPVA